MKIIFNHLIGVIMDIPWYSDRREEIDSWCQHTFGYQPRRGMVLTFKEESDKLLFTLKWL